MKKPKLNIKSMAIDVAEENIHQNGVLAIKARHIAKSIGCAVGTLYNHFSCIDDLILAVNLRTLTNLETELRQATFKTEKGNQGIQTVVDTYIKFSLEYTHAWQALFEHLIPKHAKIPQVYFQQHQQLFQHIEEQLKAAHPQMSPTNIKLESRALWSGIQGVCALAINKKLDDDHIPFQEVANTLVQHFLAKEEV
ncbi:MAG: TetR/AcrR family transcriptional regulator [Ghiorsea sp.]